MDYLERRKLKKASANFKDLLGLTLVSVTGLGPDSEAVRFVTDDGRAFVMYHQENCCESVVVESVTGDVADLIGSPLLVVEESISTETPKGYSHDYEPESQTWTFYKLATIKGYVDIRWFGSSNGYYSESVDFMEVHPDKTAPEASERPLNAYGSLQNVTVVRRWLPFGLGYRE